MRTVVFLNSGLVGYIVFGVVLCFAFLVSLLLIYGIVLRNKKKVDKTMINLIANGEDIPADEFMGVRSFSLGGRGHPIYSKNYNCEGVYAIYNSESKLVYVGKANRVVDAIHSQLFGNGNTYLARDYKSGSKLMVRIRIQVEDDLNKQKRELLKDFIEKGYKKYGSC